MKNPDEKPDPNGISYWVNNLSDERVADLFRAIKERAEQMGTDDPGLCRAMAMSVAASDLIDVFAFCVPDDELEHEIGILVHHLRSGHPMLKERWDRKLGKAPAEPRAEFALEMTCPFCGAIHAVAGIADGERRRPEDGDASLCIQCGELSVFAFDQEGNLRKPSIEELNDMAGDLSIQRMKKAWARARDLERPGPPNPKTPWKGPVQ
jgi:hypothetical protein